MNKLKYLVNDYQKKALTTAVYPGVLSGDVTYPVLGLVNELGEVQEKIIQFDEGVFNFVVEVSIQDELKPEYGDVFWYVAVLCSEIGIDISDTLPEESIELKYLNGWELDKSFIHASQIAGILKKSIRDDQGALVEDKRLKIIEHLKEVVKWSLASLQYYNIDFEEVLEYNLSKLFGRKERGTLQGSGDHR